MKEEVPSYVIKYIECSEEGHQGEKINLICLNPECHEDSLICSLCTTKHRGHNYKPIKIYLDELYRKFRHNKTSQENELEELEKRKLLLLHNLRVCVERVAEEFMRLEEDILYTYEKIKDQIHQNEARRSKFEDFYLSMIKDNYGDPKFQVKNYLFKEEIQILTDQDIFEDIAKSLEKHIKTVRKHFVQQEKPPEILKEKELQKDYLLPQNITREGENFWQTNLAANSPNLCLFSCSINDWATKLRIQLMTLPPGAKLTFGLMRWEEYQKANQVFKDSLSCMYVDSAGKSKSVQHNHIGAIQVNSSIDIFVKKNNLRILCKNNNAIINLPDKNYYFFFALDGNCKIKLTYPFGK